MASTFPNAIDAFINPVYTKVDGVDYVKASHVNDLQDAVRNIQILIAGAGIGLNTSSNNYIPTSASVKSAIEILDGIAQAREDEFDFHVNSVMPTDPFQHHGNVIQVTSIGNLNSTRVQQALEEHQTDIDAIMSGGYVEGFTLDDRYILKNGSALISGTLLVQQTITGLQDAYFGTSLSHQIIGSGSMTLGKDLVVNGFSELNGNITVSNTSKIGAKDFFAYTNLSFDNGGVQLNSFKDIVLTIDSDDAVDGESTNSSFFIKNGLGNTLFSIDEDGILFALSKIIASFAELNSHLLIGSSTQTRFEHDNLIVENNNFTIRLDSDSNDLNSAFAVTRDGDLGLVNTSTNIILKATENQLIAGSKVQTRGVPEVGYFGIKFYSDNAGGKFQGYGVNFKSKMLSIPSSVNLSIDPVKSSNYNNVTITDLNEYGFFVECDSLTVGHVVLKGTYTTVGN
jgi:hypothetical protein